MMKNEEITPAELLTGDDIIREKFRIRHAELSGYYEEANARAARNRMATLRTGTLSLNTQANCFVISADTARQIELNLGLRFDNPNARAKIFSKVYANTIVVVNERRAVFTFYVDGAAIPDTYTRNEIKSKVAKEGTSTTLQDLLKLLQGGM